MGCEKEEEFVFLRFRGRGRGEMCREANLGGVGGWLDVSGWRGNWT